MYTVGLLKHTFSHLVLRNNMPYYAVRAGRQPGVYRSWLVLNYLPEIFLVKTVIDCKISHYRPCDALVTGIRHNFGIFPKTLEFSLFESEYLCFFFFFCFYCSEKKR